MAEVQAVGTAAPSIVSRSPAHWFDVAFGASSPSNFIRGVQWLKAAALPFSSEPPPHGGGSERASVRGAISIDIDLLCMDRSSAHRYRQLDSP
jgi:hypothetical protein